jgi:hypothetical protein
LADFIIMSIDALPTAMDNIKSTIPNSQGEKIP